MDIREKIMDQTFRLLLGKGYDGVSISDIQSALGMSRGLLYHYFENKEALFEETLRCKFIDNFKIDLALTKDFDIGQMAEYMVQKYRVFDTEILREVSILDYDFLFYRAMRQSDELARIYASMRLDEEHVWRVALGNSHAKGELREGIDLDRIALQYIYATDGVWFSALNLAEGYDMISHLNDALETLNSIIRR